MASYRTFMPDRFPRVFRLGRGRHAKLLHILTWPGTHNPRAVCGAAPIALIEVSRDREAINRRGRLEVCSDCCNHFRRELNLP